GRRSASAISRAYGPYIGEGDELAEGSTSVLLLEDVFQQTPMALPFVFAGAQEGDRLLGAEAAGLSTLPRRGRLGQAPEVPPLSLRPRHAPRLPVREQRAIRAQLLE